jgi:hypothetical protein
MKPSKDRPRKPRPEFGAPARARQQLGRPLRNQRVQGRLADFSDTTSTAAAHGEDLAGEREKPPPREDRAG